MAFSFFTFFGALQNKEGIELISDEEFDALLEGIREEPVQPSSSEILQEAPPQLFLNQFPTTSEEADEIFTTLQTIEENIITPLPYVIEAAAILGLTEEIKNLISSSYLAQTSVEMLIHYRDPNGDTILHRLVRNYDDKALEIIRFLLSWLKAEEMSNLFNVINREGEAPLQLASAKYAIGMTKFIASHTTDIKVWNGLLREAAQNKLADWDIESLKLYLKVSAYPTDFKLEYLGFFWVFGCNKPSSQEKVFKTLMEEKQSLERQTFVEELLTMPIEHLIKFVESWSGYYSGNASKRDSGIAIEGPLPTSLETSLETKKIALFFLENESFRQLIDDSPYQRSYIYHLACVYMDYDSYHAFIEKEVLQRSFSEGSPLNKEKEEWEYIEAISECSTEFSVPLALEDLVEDLEGYEGESLEETSKEREEREKRFWNDYFEKGIEVITKSISNSLSNKKGEHAVITPRF